jgi:DNA-binding response OmpR family regulator
MRQGPCTILLVEDDAVSRSFLADNLLADGFEVIHAASAAAARRALSTEFVDLAVVDLGLPDGDGLELLSLVRAADRLAGRIDPGLPLIVLSGRASEVERVRGLRRGADDYVCKPFAYPELHARIDALLRRVERRGNGSRMRIGPLEIDTASHQVWMDGERVELSGKEFSLLCALAAEPFRVFTREELLCGVWGFPELCPTRTLDSHACRLRRKLSRGGSRFVINVWGVGYKLVEGAAS